MIIAISRFALGPSTALCTLYGPLPTLWSNPSTALCPPPRYSVLSKALCSLYSPLPPLRPSVPSMALSSLCSSTALYPLYDPLFPQQSPACSPTLCPLYSPLSPLWPSVPSMPFCSIYGPLKTAKLPLLFREIFYKTHFVKTPRIVMIYFVLAMIAMITIITIITQAKYSAIIAK